MFNNSGNSQLVQVGQWLCDPLTGEVIGNDAAFSGVPGREEAITRKEGVLFTAHTAPFSRAKIWASGSRIEVERSRGNQKVILPKRARGTRSAILGFTRGSRRRMLNTFAEIDKRKLPLFGTITYPDLIPEKQAWRRDLDTFIKRMKRAFPGVGVILRKEYKRRKSGSSIGQIAPHYHLAVWGVSFEALFPWVVKNWHDIAGHGDPDHKLLLQGLLPGSKPCVEKLITWGAVLYMAKYMAKTEATSVFSEIGGCGRHWGIYGAQNIPWSQVFEVLLSDRQTWLLWRSMRRYAKLRHATYHYGKRSIFCNNPNAWGRLLLRL